MEDYAILVPLPLKSQQELLSLQFFSDVTFNSSFQDSPQPFGTQIPFQSGINSICMFKRRSNKGRIDFAISAWILPQRYYEVQTA